MIINVYYGYKVEQTLNSNELISTFTSSIDKALIFETAHQRAV